MLGAVYATTNQFIWAVSETDDFVVHTARGAATVNLAVGPSFAGGLGGGYENMVELGDGNTMFQLFYTVLEDQVMDMAIRAEATG